MQTATQTTETERQPGEPERQPGEPTETEAYRALTQHGHGRFGAVPAELIARHVLAVTEGASWTVRRAALEALARRFRFARRDELIIASRPGGRRVLGAYETRRRGSRARPYRSLLEAVDPPRGSCDCPDFVKGSLGLCKHLLVVLEELFSKPRQLRRARAAQRTDAPGLAEAATPLLTWDPVRPLGGAGDWLERLTWVEGSGSAGRAVPPRALAAARERFDRELPPLDGDLAGDRPLLGREEAGQTARIWTLGHVPAPSGPPHRPDRPAGSSRPTPRPTTPNPAPAPLAHALLYQRP